MNGKCIFRGKKRFTPVLFAVALSLALFLFFGCGGGSASSGESYVSGDFGTGGNETGGGENTGNEGDDNGDENGNESGDGDEQSGNESGDENTTEKTVIQLLKDILSEEEYNKISGDVSSGDLTLMAQTIKDAGAIFPVLKQISEESKTSEGIKTEKPTEISATSTALNQALIALDKEYIDIQKSGDKYILTIKNINVKGEESYNLSEIEIDNSSKKGDFSSATFTGSNITVDKINTARGTSLPILSNITVKQSSDKTKDAKEIYNLYKAYLNKLDIVDVDGDFSAIAINGKVISENSDDYTLFENDTEAKLSSNSSIISLSADTMVQMTSKLKIKNFYNIIVSTSPSTTANVNWKLVNVIFEKDMSNITHDASNHLYGIVYFKEKMYNTSKQRLYGMLKLKELYNDNKFTISTNSINSVIDVRDVLDSNIINYNGGININGGLNSIYFKASLTSPDSYNTEKTDSKNYRGKFKAPNSLKFEF